MRSLAPTGIALFLVAAAHQVMAEPGAGGAVSELPPGRRIQPSLVFRGDRESPDSAFGAPRNFTVDDQGNLYLFDYDDYTIRKFDVAGRHVVTFGGKMDESGGALRTRSAASPEGGPEFDGFEHLMAIEVIGGRLLALDSAGTTWFSLDGRPLGSTRFPVGVICDHPRPFRDGRFLGHQTTGDALAVLTLRGPDGSELDRLATHDLGEFFPGVKPGEAFFLNGPHARTYLYDFVSDGRVVWAASDAPRVYLYEDGRSSIFFSADLSPRPYPQEKVEALEAQRERLPPPLFLHVPSDYRVLNGLTVGPNDDVWLNLGSLEASGLLRISREGRVQELLVVEADFDLGEAIVRHIGDRLYFMVTGSRGVAVYESPLLY